MKPVFSYDARHRTSVPILVARIAAGIDHKKILLEVLHRELRLPDYFGMNWDALDECLRDFWWLPPGQVVLVHEDLPLRPNVRDQRIYISTLYSGCGKWEHDGARSFRVEFPEDARQQVDWLLQFDASDISRY